LEAIDPSDKVGKALYEAGRACNRLGWQDDALAYYARAAALQEDIGDFGGLGDTINNIGYVYLGQQKWTEAAACFTRALNILEKTTHLYGQAAALTKSWCHPRLSATLD
jgi:tetratricopeptide (TPR) repeat protein